MRRNAVAREGLWDVTTGADPGAAGPDARIAKAANEAQHLEFVTLNNRLVA